jgi:hypothetical protein
VDVIVCSSTAAERVRQLADPAVQVMIDDRALDQRAIEMLASARKPGAARSALISADRSTRAQVSVPRRRHRGLQERCRWFNHLIRPPQKECGRDEYAEHPATERPAEYRRDSLATDHATMHELEGDWFTVLTRS